MVTDLCMARIKISRQATLLNHYLVFLSRIKLTIGILPEGNLINHLECRSIGLLCIHVGHFLPIFPALHSISIIKPYRIYHVG